MSDTRFHCYGEAAMSDTRFHQLWLIWHEAMYIWVGTNAPHHSEAYFLSRASIHVLTMGALSDWGLFL